MAWPKALKTTGVIESLKHKIGSLQERWRGARREIERLRQENEQLRQEKEQLREEQRRLHQEQERLRQENERLKRQLEEAQRAHKRQAAPFSRGRRKANPKSPGRKRGAAYGQRHSKAIPEQVDEVMDVPLPAHCSCGGALEVEKVESQYQHEVVRKTIWRRFDIAIGRCRVCHQRVQGRDPRQTSDALGAAAVQLGAQALALAVKMNKGLGMPHGDVATVLQDSFGLEVQRSTICRAVERVARRGEATWHALRDAARRSMVNAIDETGWNVAAQLRWLWVVVSEQVTFCDILPGRGFDEAASLLGADYEGWLTHDGWVVYYKFLRAGHQSCISHLLRRCRDLAELGSPAAARFPLAVKALLEKSLALRDRYRKQEISRHGLWTATGRLEVELDRLLTRAYRDSANRRLAKHLIGERPYLFTFLYCPGLDATNNAAEHALRPLVIARKNWGGNRTEKGARAQAVLSSILASAQQQGKNPLDGLIELLVSQDPSKILDLVPPTRGAPQTGCSATAGETAVTHGSSPTLEDRECTSHGVRCFVYRAVFAGQRSGPYPTMSVESYASPRGNLGSVPGCLRFCGRLFSGAELELIVGIARDYPGLAVTEMARTVCELLDWKRANERLKDQECRQLLEHLCDQGWLKLPPVRNSGPCGPRQIGLSAASAPQARVEGSAGEFEPLELRVVESRAESQLWTELIERHHYLHYRVPVGANLRYLVRSGQRGAGVLACLLWSSPAWKMAARDEWIGWNVEQRTRNLQLIVNNSRFLVLPWVRIQGLASKILAHNARQLPIDWERRYGYRPLLLETLVDAQRFRGTCYRAANWIHAGQTSGRGRMDREHKTHGQAVKDIYLYPLARNTRQRLCVG